MSLEKIENPEKKFRPFYRSDFTMGELDFKRFNSILLAVNEFKINFVGDRRNIIGFLVAVETLYDEWAHLFRDEQAEDVAGMLKVATVNVNSLMTTESRMGQDKVSFSNYKRVFDQIREIHRQLLRYRQGLGFGIRVTRYETEQKKIKRGLSI